MLDYKSLRAAVRIGANVVNIQTHRRTDSCSILTNLYE